MPPWTSSAPDPTTPTEPRPHGATPRGLEAPPSSRLIAGRFGRMFPADMVRVAGAT
jgi:hypothetical protein